MSCISWPAVTSAHTLTPHVSVIHLQANTPLTPAKRHGHEADSRSNRREIDGRNDSAPVEKRRFMLEKTQSYCFREWWIRRYSLKLVKLFWGFSNSSPILWVQTVFSCSYQRRAWRGVGLDWWVHWFKHFCVDWHSFLKEKKSFLQFKKKNSTSF